MMRPYAIGSIALVGALMLAQPVLAMGGDYRLDANGNIVSGQPDWPVGLAELINCGPVFSGHWVNADSEFFFLGDSASLTRFLKRYAALKDTPVMVVIHAGSERHSELWGDKPKEKYDWKLLLRKRDRGATATPGKPGRWLVTVDVWIDRNIRLSALERPKNVEVRSGGEIERFVLFAAGKDLPTAGWQTYSNYDKAARAGREKKVGDGVEIPARYWSDALKALHPVRVYVHRLNVVVVQQVENNTEQGKYITNPISSYAPRTGADGFTFTPDRVTGVLDFTRTRGK